MTITINGPDGATYNFPDETPPDEMTAALAKVYPHPSDNGTQTQHPGALAGAARALEANLPFVDRAVASAQSVLPQGYGGTGKDYAANLAEEKAKNATFSEQNPWTNAVGGLAAYAPAALLPGGVGLAGRVGTGALTGFGLGGLQGASNSPDLTDSAQTGRAIAQGELTGGALGAAVPAIAHGIGIAYNAVARPEVNMLASALHGVSPADMASAQALMQDAERRGVALTSAEAIQQATGAATDLGRLQRIVEGTKGGASVMAPFMAERPAKVQGAVSDVLNRIAPPPVDVAQAPGMTGMAGQKAATDAIMAAERGRTAAVNPLYEAAGKNTVPLNGVSSMISKANKIETAETGKPISLNLFRGSSVETDPLTMGMDTGTRDSGLWLTDSLLRAKGYAELKNPTGAPRGYYEGEEAKTFAPWVNQWRAKRGLPLLTEAEAAGMTQEKAMADVRRATVHKIGVDIKNPLVLDIEHPEKWPNNPAVETETTYANRMGHDSIIYKNSDDTGGLPGDDKAANIVLLKDGVIRPSQIGQEAPKSSIHEPLGNMTDFIDSLSKQASEDKTGIVGQKLLQLRNDLLESKGTQAVPSTRTPVLGPNGQIVRYETTPAVEAVPPKPLTDIESLDRVRKYHRDILDLPQIGQDAITKEQSATVSNALGKLNDLMEANSPSFVAGKQKFQDLTASHVAPISSGPLGKVAASPELRAQTSALFPTQPLEGAPQETSRAIAAINQQDQNIAAQLARQHLATNFAEKAQQNIPGENQWGGAKFAAHITGNPLQADVLNAGLGALPKGAEVQPDVNALLEVLRATGKRQAPGSLTAQNTLDLKDLSAAGAIGTALHAAHSPISAIPAIVAQFGDAVTRARLFGHSAALAKALTANPDEAFAAINATIPRGRPRGPISRAAMAAALAANADIQAQRNQSIPPR